MALPPARTSCLPECNRQASHIKRGYEICRKVEDENGESTPSQGGQKEWSKVERKQHDRENKIVLFTLEGGKQLRVKSTEKILSRRGVQSQGRGEANE